MRIVLTLNEAKMVKEAMESMETGACDEFLKALENNQIMNVNVNYSRGIVELTVNDKYIIDVMTVYNKYLPLIISQVKGTIDICQLLMNDTEKVVKKYSHIVNLKKEPF